MREETRSGYDALYSQFDMVKTPFGQCPDYDFWRDSQVKGPLAKWITRNGKVLDVGGGTGVFGKVFMPRIVESENYHVLDVSLVMLKYSRYSRVCGVAEFLPFRESSFDFLVMSEVLEHVSDKVAALKECHRLLKPSGLLLLSTPRTGWRQTFKRSPFIVFIVLDRLLRQFRSNRNVQAPLGVRDEPSDEAWLRDKLQQIGFTVVFQARGDHHLLWGGMGKFWRWFADKVVDEKKFGHCTIIVARHKTP